MAAVEFDVAIVGGGPSGLMAAIAASEQGARVLLIEKGGKLGRKLGISGGGRCNVTNAKPLPELMQNIPGNGRFLHSALARFANSEIMAYFEGLGIRLKEEDRGRVFPVSDKAQTVVQALVDDIHRRGVTVWRETPVRSLLADAGRATGLELGDGQRIAARAVVIAAGGCSVPQTGSTGDAYPWAQSVGHAIVPPYPTEVPLTSDEPFIAGRALQGLALRGVSVTVLNGSGRRLTVEHGDLLFTHFGLSGPVALRCSHYVSTERRKHPDAQLTALVDCLPDIAADDFIRTLEDSRKRDPRKQLATVLAAWLPERLATLALAQTGVDGTAQMANASTAALVGVARWSKSFPVRLTGTLPLAQATVTGGGVSVKEIDPRTMGSKLCAGLYFCGEVMDVHAHTGGYNITVAFSTGHLAGESAAAYAREPRERDVATSP